MLIFLLYFLLFKTGEILLNKRHEATPEIQKRVNNLIAKWNELMKASSERGKGLEEARDILKFNEEVEKVEAWIREKVWFRLALFDVWLYHLCILKKFIFYQSKTFLAPLY